MAKSGTLNTNVYNNSCFFVDWSFAKNNGRVATLNYSIGLDMWSYAWWGTNAVVIRDVYIAGKKVTTGGTYSNLSGNPNNRQTLITGSVDLNVDSNGRADFNIQFNGWLYANGDISKTENFTLDGVSVHPEVKVEKVSVTATSLVVKASVTNGVSASKYKFMCNGETKETSSNQVTFENLTPNRAYTVKCSGYSNGGYGSEASISITTNSKCSISKIGEFTIDGVTMTISGDSNCNVVVLVNGEETIRRKNVSSGAYTLTLTEDEKNRIYELIGNDNSLTTTIRIETGTEVSDITKSITLTGDVFSCHVKVNGVVKRGKVWIGTLNGNKQGIFTIGTSNGNVRGR